MEASLLGQVEEEPRTPTPEEEVPSWVRELGPQETLALLPNMERRPGAQNWLSGLLLLLLSFHPTITLP